MAFTGFRLRGTDGRFKGLWLTGITVFKNGLPFQVLNWDNVVSRANEFVFNPAFSADANSAWSGFTKENAERFQAIASISGIPTEIVEP
jgi:hypothetical protein